VIESTINTQNQVMKPSPSTLNESKVEPIRSSFFAPNQPTKKLEIFFIQIPEVLSNIVFDSPKAA
jgi:hypothetical protein